MGSIRNKSHKSQSLYCHNFKFRFIETDAIFMPVQKVDFKVENVYDRLGNIKERLFIDIWTNGSILPEQAISLGSKIIVELFNSIDEQKIKKEKETIKEKKNVKFIDPYTHIAIEELQLSVRPYNCLKRAQINTIGDLLKYSPEKLLELKILVESLLMKFLPPLKIG